MKKIKKTLALFFAMMLVMTSCGGNAKTQNTTTETQQAVEATRTDETTTDSEHENESEEQKPEAPESELSDRSFPVSEEYTKLTGRTAMDENGVRWIIHSASKAEFKMTGTRASIVVCGDATARSADTSSQARFAVYVNGNRTMDHLVSEQEETIEIFNSDEITEAEISIVKLSEATNSVFGIKSIDAAVVEDIEPLPEKKLKLEFVGDSITCGYGIDDEDRSHHFKTATEDATKTYAYKTAENLEADCSFISYSGHGIISGYTGDGQKAAAQTVPALYEKLGKTYGSADDYIDLNEKWDFSRFVPDYIIINLGTNDSTYTLGDPARMEEFTEGYVDFLETVRKNNSGAHIICSMGVMGDSLFSCMEDAVGRYTEATGDKNVSTLRLPAQDGSLGYAADWHPTESTNEIVAEVLTEYIRENPSNEISKEEDEMAATLLYQGHASVRIVTAEGKVIYLDPFMGDGYDLPADLILMTHGHYDHTQDSLISEKNGDCETITWKEALAGGTHQSFDLGYVKVEAVEAGYNRNHDVSECVGFILTFSDGVTVYFSGDTSTTPTMEQLSERNLDYAFICCDGVYNMDVKEASECAKKINAKHSIPYHMVPSNNSNGFDMGVAEQLDVPGRTIVQPGEELVLSE